jgi:AcrR family transcriptional regulator
MSELTTRQNQIVTTTIELIHSGGIQSFTIKNLSHLMGFTEAAIYRHFASKQDILCAILDKFINSLNDFSKIILALNANSIDKIEKIYNQLTNVFTKNPAYVSVIFAEEIFKNNKTLSSKVGKILDINNHTFMSIIKTGQSNHEIIKTVDSQELTLLVMGGYRLMVKHWKMDDFSYNLKDRSDKLIKSVKMIITDRN